MTTVNPAPGSGAKPVTWRKRYRAPLMNAAFVIFWIAFPLGYLGGIQNNSTLTSLSFILICAGCLVPLVTKK
jgi:hypothetical protein